MFAIVSFYCINVSYQKKKSDRCEHKFVFKVKKYVDVYSRKTKLVVKAYFDRGYDAHLTSNLQSSIVQNDKLTTIEVGRDNYTIISQDDIDIQNILITDRLDNKEVFVIPSKHDENFLEYFKVMRGDSFPLADLSGNYYLENKAKHISMKQFIDDFNTSKTDYSVFNMVNEDIVKKCNLNEFKYDITNSIEEEVEKVCNYIDETAEEITECINNINRSIRDELMNINVELTTLKSKKPAQKNIIDNYCILTHDNLLDETISYHKDNDVETIDIVEVIKMMLNSSKYILSYEFKKNKIDLKDIQFKFKELASPESITRDDILLEVFNIDNSVSLL